MKLFFVVFVSALALSAADPQAKKDTSKESASATSKASDTAKPSAIPAGAVKGDDGDYHYTDTQGKKWIYHKTPFGMSRREDTGELETAKAPDGAGIKATEDGDKVRFERQGPFGVWKWEKKKSELNENEKAALQNSQANSKTASKQD